MGLVRVLDDTEMVAYMHYVLVDPEYQGRGIAGHLVGMVKQRYHDLSPEAFPLPLIFFGVRLSDLE